MSPCPPALREDGFVLCGPRGVSRPRRGSISLLLGELKVPPLPSISWLWDMFFIVGDFIAVAVPGRSSQPCSVICIFPPLSLLTMFALELKTSQFRKLSKLKMRNLSLFSPPYPLPLWLFLNWGSSGARLHPAGRDLQHQATRGRV